MPGHEQTEQTEQTAPAANRRESLAWVSWLRVLAIVAVMTIHTSGATAVLPDARQTPEGILAIILNRGGNFAVVLFVMVSGALVLDPSRYPGDASFLRKRAWRLVPAIVVWHLFYWWFHVAYLHESISPRTALVRTLDGRLSTALYFFWIVLGLAIVSPLLVAWLRGASRRAVLVAGSLGVAMAGLTTATVGLRGAPVVWVETPWTWWVLYLGAFLLGWGLRGVRLRPWATVTCLVVPIVVMGSVAWWFRAEHVPRWFSPLAGGYYSFGVQITATCVLLAGQQLIRDGGPLAALSRGRAARWARTVGDATLGIFALHIAVLELSYRIPLVAGDAPAQTVRELVGRLTFVIVVSTALAVLGRRVPVIRRVL
jgi:surface polysaccharide O-acyltransferase-like enzyme